MSFAATSHLAAAESLIRAEHARRYWQLRARGGRRSAVERWRRRLVTAQATSAAAGGWPALPAALRRITLAAAACAAGRVVRVSCGAGIGAGAGGGVGGKGSFRRETGWGRVLSRSFTIALPLHLLLPPLLSSRVLPSLILLYALSALASTWPRSPLTQRHAPTARPLTPRAPRTHTPFARSSLSCSARRPQPPPHLKPAPPPQTRPPTSNPLRWAAPGQVEGLERQLGAALKECDALQRTRSKETAQVVRDERYSTDV